MCGDGETSEEQSGSWGAIRTLVRDISRVQIPVTHPWNFELTIGSESLEVG